MSLNSNLSIKVSKLERVYWALHRADTGRGGVSTSPAMLVITLLYLIAVLSVSVYEPQKLVWLAAYPIIISEKEGIGFLTVLKRSLWIIPLLVLIGIFNPIYDKAAAFHLGDITVTRGWMSFTSIILRGLLSIQAVIIMVDRIGFIEIFNTFRTLHLPSILCSQLSLTYRYLSVIIEEAISMRRARASRGYGRKSYPFSLWGRFIGQLLIRSSQRAMRIHRAMIARGFDGSLPLGREEKWGLKDWFMLMGWSIVIGALRFIDFSHIIYRFLG